MRNKMGRRVAFCGLLTALAVVLAVLSGAVGVGTFAGPILAMAALLPVLEEYGAKTALTAYAATALLTFWLVPDRELVLIYAAFGWYPVLQPALLRVKSCLLRAALQIVLCTAVLLFLYGVLLRLLGIPTGVETGRWFGLALLAMGNVIFLLTDRVLLRLKGLWHAKLRRRFLK